MSAHAVSDLADPEQGRVDGIVDLATYPLDAAGSPAWTSVVDRVRRELAEAGAAQLPGFLTPAATAAIAGELARTAEHVPIRHQRASVYARGALEAELPTDDPRRTELEWFAGHVTRDMIPPFSAAQRLYVCAGFKAFIAACVGRDRVYEYADPLAGLVATILPPGGRYPWHYDTNEFVVTIMIRPPEAGGRFQYWKDLRTPGDENLDGLGAVLDGSDRSGLREITSRPGDLQLFLGRYSLHQVTEVVGESPRHVLVLSYAEQPGVIGPLDRTRAVYGRVTEAHLLAAGMLASDGLIL